MTQPATQQTPNETWTVQRLLQWTADWLTKAGSPTGRLDGDLLLAHVLRCNRLQLLLRFDQPVQRDELAQFKQLIRRRSKLEPIAYILGRKGFHDIEINVTPAVLVPRPETEILVDDVAAYLHDARAAAGPVLDLCTGSGCIALALCRDLEKLHQDRTFWAVDLSAAALAVAQDNAVQLGRSVQWCQGDLWDALPPGCQFAVVVSNPPYVRTADWEHLDPDVKLFEPRLALDGGRDGLDVARRIVLSAPRHLVKGGLLALELGDRQQGIEIAALLDQAGFKNVRSAQVHGSPTHIVTAHWTEGSDSQK